MIKRLFEHTGKPRVIPLLLALLLICTAATTAALTTGMIASADNADLTIDLMPEGGNNVQVLPLAYTEGAQLHRLSEKPYPFYAEDDVQFWTTETQVDIFKIEYENGENQITVAGNGDKVIAPGTENTYSFRLKNNGPGIADYKVQVDGHGLPVEARFNSQKNGWLVGDEEQWLPVIGQDAPETEDPDAATTEKGEERTPATGLHGVEDTGILYSGKTTEYELYWRWPFERDLDGDGDISDGDAMDTLLGNLATEQDVTLTIRITTLCNYHWPVYPPVIAPIPAWLNGKDHIAYLFGYPDGTVRPNANITRGEVATIFYRLLKPEIREEYYKTTNDYPDVPKEKWCCVEISTLTNLGVLEGYPDGTFGPDDTITRAEFATICARFADREPPEKTELKDIKKHWAKDHIMICEGNNWIIGYEDKTFRPENDITRAEAVTIVNRMLHRLPEQLSDLLDGMIQWPDNQDTNAWYYIAVQEASNGHDYRRLTGTREKWTALNNLQAF